MSSFWHRLKTALFGGHPAPEKADPPPEKPEPPELTPELRAIYAQQDKIAATVRRLGWQVDVIRPAIDPPPEKENGGPPNA